MVSDTLVILPLELVKIIIKYYSFFPNGKFLTQWKFPKDRLPWCITSSSTFCFINDENSERLYQYTFKGELKQTLMPSLIMNYDNAKWNPYFIEYIEETHLLYITHRTYPRVLMIIEIGNNNYKLQRQWNLPYDGDGTSFLKVDQTNQCIFVSIPERHQIICYTCDGKEIQRFGRNGKGEGQFSYPHGITLDEKYLYICDNSNHRIQVIDKLSAQFIREWGTQGSTLPGEFYAIFFITLYSELLYISDSYRVQVYSKRGKFICYIGKAKELEGKAEGEFDWPRAICCLGRKVYVCDANNNRIQVFS